MKMSDKSPAAFGVLSVLSVAFLVSACAPAKFSSLSSTSNQALSSNDSVTEASPAPSPAPTPVLEPTPSPSATPASGPTPSPTPFHDPTPAPSPTPVVVPPITPTPACTPKPTPAATPVATPVATPKPMPEAVSTTESFDQDERANKLDILIVNDNSPSMDVEQSKMSTRFTSFMSALNDVDYQMGMTTTDLDSRSFGEDGKLLTWSGTTIKILNSMVPDLEDVFLHTVQRKETLNCQHRRLGCPSGNEQPLKAVIRAIDHEYDFNAGFFRDKVPLVVVVLSDEDEMSSGPNNATKPEEVLARFKSRFGESKPLSVYGLIIQEGDVACREMQRAQTSDRQSAYYGTSVTELARLTGGKTFSICDDDYGKNLSVISEEARQLVAGFTLAHLPIAGSVEVTVSPRSQMAFRVEGNKVIFESAPPAGTHISVSYKYQP